MAEQGEKWFWTGVDRVMNIVLLGFLWLICSLPVITIGASSAALNVAMSDYVRGDCHSVMKSFFTAFRQHWPLATKIWLIHLIVIAVLLWDLIYYRTGESTQDVLGATVAAVGLMLVFFELLMVYAVLAEFPGLTVKTALVRALDLAFTCFFESLSIAVLTLAVPVAVFFLLPGFLPALPGLIAYLDWQILPKMFQKAKFKKGNREQNRAVRKPNQ